MRYKKNPEGIRVYSNFYCSLSEWYQLGKDKENFMYQVRSEIVNRFGLEFDKIGVDESKLWVSNDTTVYDYDDRVYAPCGLALNKLSFDIHGRRDELDGEIYSAWIVERTIELITHRQSKVEFFSWKGNLDHIEISFPEREMPNIIVLTDVPGGDCSTNKALIACMDAIYHTLSCKTTVEYDKYLRMFFNDEYDYVFYKCDYFYGCNSDYYHEWHGKWKWKDCIKARELRFYDHYGTLHYAEWDNSDMLRGGIYVYNDVIYWKELGKEPYWKEWEKNHI